MLGLSFVTASVVAIFLLNLALFVLRHHGPRSGWRLQIMLTQFPWWIPLIGLLSLFTAVLVLHKYEFSYRKNFQALIIGCVLAILGAVILIEATGINDAWVRSGRMRRWYQLQDGDAVQGMQMLRPARQLQQRRWQ